MDQNYPPAFEWQNLPDGTPPATPDRGATAAKVAGAAQSLRPKRTALTDIPEGANA